MIGMRDVSIPTLRGRGRGTSAEKSPTNSELLCQQQHDSLEAPRRVYEYEQDLRHLPVDQCDDVILPSVMCDAFIPTLRGRGEDITTQDKYNTAIAARHNGQGEIPTA